MFGESLAQLDAIIAKIEGSSAPAPAAAAAAAAAPAPAPAKEKDQKKKKAPAPVAKKKGNAPTPPQPLFTKLDLRVGKIVDVWEHPDSEKLWCEKVRGAPVAAADAAAAAAAAEAAAAPCLTLVLLLFICRSMWVSPSRGKSSLGCVPGIPRSRCLASG